MCTISFHVVIKISFAYKIFQLETSIKIIFFKYVLVMKISFKYVVVMKISFVYKIF